MSTALNSQKTLPGEDVSILYKVKWEDEKDETRQQIFRSEVPIGPLEVTTESFSGTTSVLNPLNRRPAIEIVNTILGHAPKVASNEKGADASEDESEPRNRSQSPTRGSKSKYKPVAFQDIKITEIGDAMIRIHSEDLLQKMCEVIKYFPEQSLTGDFVVIKYPYAALVHHLDDLETRQKQLEESENRTGKHLKALLQFLKRSIGPRLGLARARLLRPVPVVTFNDLWILFKPGNDAYCYLNSEEYGQERTAFVVWETQVVFPSREERREGKMKSFRVKLWGLESNGVRVTRTEGSRSIGWYEGERKVTSLPIYPSQFQDKTDGGKSRRELQDRGERIYELMRAQPKQMRYEYVLAERSKQMYRGTALIDTTIALANKEFPAGSNEEDSIFANAIDFHGNDTDMTNHTLESFPWASYHNITIENAPKLPSRHHYYLVQPLVPGFALGEKKWRLFPISTLTDMEYDATTDGLIIDPGNRDIVQAICLAQSHPWKIDNVSNKGEGQVALLHGPPGVGKTYTVECIAQATGRPLIALTIGDLIDEEEKIEAKLVKWFSLAERWKAILLLDEADIFLERRATRDIQRNGIVSIFLRRMEYFSGLLFLTTNRVGQIDDAFLSRVTVVLQYENLTDDTRKKIWTGFFKKLQMDSERQRCEHKGSLIRDKCDNRKIEVDRYAQKYVLNDPEVRDLRWNGREIRNALQTAISLASYKALKEGHHTDLIEIEEEHFKTVVDMSRKFKKYMSSITGKEEGERARARLERADPRQSMLT